MFVIEVTWGGMAGLSEPAHVRPCGSGVAGSLTLWYASPGPLTARLTFAVLEARLLTVAVQWDCPTSLMESGEQVCVSFTTPGVLTNATGMVTGVPPFFGVSVIRARYWPFATSGALIFTGKVTVPPMGTFSGLLLFPTVILTPAGWLIDVRYVMSWSATLVAVRWVVISPLIVVSSMLARFRSTRWIESLPAATKFA